MTRETYRGVKLSARALRGRDYGKVRCTVNGVVFGDWIGTESAQLESMRRTVDAAGERPDAYPEHWHPSEESDYDMDRHGWPRNG